MAKSRDPRPPAPIVRYSPLGELKVYQISEGELERLEAGPPGQLSLNFALMLLPTAISFAVTLLTTKMDTPVSIAFQIAFWLCLVQGIYALVHWMMLYRAHEPLAKQIRARLPDMIPEGEQLVSELDTAETTGTNP